MSTMFAIWMPRLTYVVENPVMQRPRSRLCKRPLTDNLEWGDDRNFHWVKADQYIQLTVNADTTIWGIQIYTDNTAPDANPVFTTTVTPEIPDLTLRPRENTARPGLTVPLAWSIHADTTSSVANAGDPATDTEWFYIQDLKTPSFPCRIRPHFLQVRSTAK